MLIHTRILPLFTLTVNNYFKVVLRHSILFECHVVLFQKNVILDSILEWSYIQHQAVLNKEVIPATQ